MEAENRTQYWGKVASRGKGDTARTGEDPGSSNTDERCMAWYLLSGDFIPTGHPNIDRRFQMGMLFFLMPETRSAMNRDDSRLSLSCKWWNVFVYQPV